MEKDLRHRAIDMATSGIIKILKLSPNGLMTKASQLIDFGLSALVYSEEFHKTIDLINSGCTPVVVLNHQSHADIIPMAVISKLIMGNVDSRILNGFLLPYAASAESGHQGEIIQKFFYALEPWLLAHGVIFIRVVRAKDTKKYGITDSSTEALKELYWSPQNHMGIIIVPEGTVQGGRKDAHGNINGMVKAEDGLGRILNHWLRSKIPFFVLPVGVNGTYNLLNPDTLRPTAEALKALTRNTLLHAEPIKLAQVKIGMPLMSDVIGKQGNCDSITSFIMHHVAGLVPTEARGFYK